MNNPKWQGMEARMQWHHLYSDKRVGTKTGFENSHDSLRTSFIKDYDRIIFSSAFRRLQNKTQVFPLPGPAFVHNRLTHSLEVASVGRSLGKAVGQEIADKYAQQYGKAFDEFYRYELSSVIAAACLAHDIGNPPFGHSGEDAIRNYFLGMDATTLERYQDELSANQWADFTHFEGNSNAFRILTHNFAEEESAYNITQTTLASIVKYPSSSLLGFDKSSGLISRKKSGFFDSEIARWEQIATALQIPKISGAAEDEPMYMRHPFVFLTEAADDICYRIVDIEDAHRLGIAHYNEVLELFLPFFEDDVDYYNKERILGKLKRIKDPNQGIQYLRAVWIGKMIQLCSRAFMHHEDELLNGNLQKSLLETLPKKLANAMERIDDFSISRIYHHRFVVEIEITGFKVIGDLLDIFIKALLQPELIRSQKVLQLIPTQFPIKLQKGSLYEDTLSITDFISGMTDLYAIDLYRNISGITIKAL